MIYNDEKLEIEKVEAFYIIRKTSCDTYIKISSKDNNITFDFKDKNFDPRKLEFNKKINLIEYINWDVELITKETYYLFDLSKDKVYLTRLDDNQFKIEVNIEKPDMIYTPLGENKSFKNLIVNTEFSFIYED